MNDDRRERVEQMRVIDDQQQVVHVVERVVGGGEETDRLKGTGNLHDAGEGSQWHISRRLSAQDEMSPPPIAADPISNRAGKGGLADAGITNNDNATEGGAFDGVHGKSNLCRSRNERPLHGLAAFPSHGWPVRRTDPRSQ